MRTALLSGDRLSNAFVHFLKATIRHLKIPASNGKLQRVAAWWSAILSALEDLTNSPSSTKALQSPKFGRSHPFRLANGVLMMLAFAPMLLQ